MALLSIVGIGVGIYVVWSWLFRQRQNWSPHELGVLVVLTVLCILCRCLPLYVRDDCTIDMSFISILAVVLLLGPEAAVAIIFLTTPLEVIPTAVSYTHLPCVGTAAGPAECWRRATPGR